MVHQPAGGGGRVGDLPERTALAELPHEDVAVIVGARQGLAIGAEVEPEYDLCLPLEPEHFPHVEFRQAGDGLAAQANEVPLGCVHAGQAPEIAQGRAAPAHGTGQPQSLGLADERR